MSLVLAALTLLATPQVEASDRAATLLYVRTVPPGATVLVDGKEIGQSDRLFPAPAGTRRVVILLDGYQPVSQDVDITSDQITRLVLALQRPPLPVQTRQSHSPSPPDPLLRAPKWAYVYQMKIEADQGTWIEELSGRVEYQVRGYDPAPYLSTMGTMWKRIRRAKANSAPFDRELIQPPFPIGQSQFHLIHPLHDACGQPSPAAPPGRDVLLFANLPARLLRPRWSSSSLTWNASDPAPLRVTGDTIPYPSHPLLADLDISAVEKIVFHLEASDGDRTTARKHYELCSLEKLASGPRLEISGDGSGVLDLKRWIPLAFEFTARITLRDRNQTAEIPLRLTYHLMSARPLSQSSPKEPLTGDELDRVLEQLHSGNENRLVCTLRELQLLPPDLHSHVFPQVLESLYQSADPSGPVRREAAAALSLFATPNCLPVLRTALRDPLPCVRASAIAALCRLRDQVAIPQVVSALDDLVTRGAAIAFLETIGPICESNVIDHLAAPDPWVRAACCEVLREVGSSEAVAPLQKAMKDAHWQVRMLAEEATTAIERRRAAEDGQAG